MNVVDFGVIKKESANVQPDSLKPGQTKISSNNHSQVHKSAVCKTIMNQLLICINLSTIEQLWMACLPTSEINLQNG